MAKVRDYHLNKDKLAELEIAIRRDKRPEVRQRSMAIRHLHMGHKVEDVTHVQAVSKPTIYGWWKRWCAGGVEGLANRPKSGRPPKADEAVYRPGGRSRRAKSFRAGIWLHGLDD